MLVLHLGLKLLFPSEGELLYFALRIVRYALVGLTTGHFFNEGDFSSPMRAKVVLRQA